MRKIKDPAKKVLNKIMNDVKPVKIDSEDTKEVNRALFTVSLTMINILADELFKFNKQVGKIRYYNIDSLHFKNQVICEDSFKKEFVLIKRFLKLLYNKKPITQEVIEKRLSYTKNPNSSRAFELTTIVNKNRIMLFMRDYLNDIKDRYMLEQNNKFILYLASIITLKNILIDLKNDDLLDMYDKEILKEIRCNTTKLYNRIPYCLKELTGRDNVTEFKVKSVLEMFGDTKYNIKEIV